MSDQNFESFLRPEFIELVKFLDNQGLKIGVVGGTVRDFLLSLSNKHDYDCEVRFKNGRDEKTLLADFLNIEFPKHIKKEICSYHVVKLTHPLFRCEVSLPREEKFIDDEFDHKNFSVEFVHDEFYYKSFLRRDFTCNAMMYEYIGPKKWKFIDPLGGYKDLKNNILRACSENFVKDPVRFLRAVRFSILLKFDLDKALKKFFIDYFHATNINILPNYYLHKEAKKSQKPLTFSLMFMRLFKNEEICEDEKFLTQYEKLNENKISVHLKKYFYLPRQKLDSIYSFLQLKKKYDPKMIKSFSGFSISFISNNSFSELKKNHDYVQLLLGLDALSKLEQIYFEQAYIYLNLPLDYNDLHSMMKIDIDCSHVSNNEKALFLLHARLKKWYK